MPYYKITGLHSHRHPFLGDELTTTPDASIATVPSVTTGEIKPEAGTTQAASQLTLKSGAVTAVVSGLVSGLAAYAVAREVGVDKPKATNLSVVMGLLSMIGQVAGTWLHNKLVSLQQSGG